MRTEPVAVTRAREAADLACIAAERALHGSADTSDSPALYRWYDAHLAMQAAQRRFEEVLEDWQRSGLR